MGKGIRNIVLFGFMGTGKSSVGKILAQKLGREFVEMDALIEAKEGTTINEIFASKGEPFFRRLERGLVQELSKKSGLVISTGGGVVLDEKNIEDLRENGLLFSLTASAGTVFERTKNESHRPLLKTEDPLKKIKELLEFRTPFYKKADFIIETDGKTISEVAEEILKVTRNQ